MGDWGLFTGNTSVFPPAFLLAFSFNNFKFCIIIDVTKDHLCFKANEHPELKQLRSGLYSM